MRRVCGIAFGIGTHVLFFYTVYRTFLFLYADTVVSPRGSLWLDALLAGQFALSHSMLLYPAVRQRLCRWIPREFYGCFFCVVTCVSLLAMYAGWRSSGAALWRLEGWPYGLVEAAFFANWGLLFHALWVSGLGYQTGFTPWWHWYRGQPLPDRLFRPRSWFLHLRHPVYLSLMGLTWFNPVMTFDRFLLACVWSTYVFIGSYLKDERLAYFMGDAYRRYQEQVPGYPLIPFGPLARRKPRPQETTAPQSEAAASGAA